MRRHLAKLAVFTAAALAGLLLALTLASCGSNYGGGGKSQPAKTGATSGGGY